MDTSPLTRIINPTGCKRLTTCDPVNSVQMRNEKPSFIPSVVLKLHFKFGDTAAVF